MKTLTKILKTMRALFQIDQAQPKAVLVLLLLAPVMLSSCEDFDYSFPEIADDAKPRHVYYKAGKCESPFTATLPTDNTEYLRLDTPTLKGSPVACKNGNLEKSFSHWDITYSNSNGEHKPGDKIPFTRHGKYFNATAVWECMRETYDLAGGTGEIVPACKDPNQTYNLSDGKDKAGNFVYKKGYYLAGWQKNGTGTTLALSSSGEKTPDDDSTPMPKFKAVWKPVKVTVNFNAGSAGSFSTAPSPVSGFYDSTGGATSVAIPSTAKTNYYTLASWNTQQDESGATISGNVAVKDLWQHVSYVPNDQTVTLTLFAQWEGKPITVKYEAGTQSGASLPSAPTNLKYGGSFSPSTATTTYYNLDKWMAKNNGGSSVYDKPVPLSSTTIGSGFNDYLAQTGNTLTLTLQAQWEGKPVTVKFDIFASGISQNDITDKKYGDNVVIDTVHNSCKIVNKWNNGSTTINASSSNVALNKTNFGDFTPSGNGLALTLKAVAKPKTVKITYKPNGGVLVPATLTTQTINACEKTALTVGARPKDADMGEKVFDEWNDSCGSNSCTGDIIDGKYYLTHNGSTSSPTLADITLTAQYTGLPGYGTDVSWAKSSMSAFDSSFNDVAVDSSGNSYAVGTQGWLENPDPSNHSSATITTLQPCGNSGSTMNTLRHRNYYTTSNPCVFANGPNKTASTSGGGYSPFQGRAAVVVKYDNNGVAQWAYSTEDVNGTGNDYVSTSFNGVVSSGSGSGAVAVGYLKRPNGSMSGNPFAKYTGESNSSQKLKLNDNNFKRGSVIIKYDQDGKITWANIVKAPNSDLSSISYFNKIATDGTNFYVVGYQSSGKLIYGSKEIDNSTTGSAAEVLIKYKSDGSVLWGKHQSLETFNDVAHYNGQIYIAGDMKGAGIGATVTRYNANNGQKITEIKVTSNGESSFTSIAATSNGIYAVGYQQCGIDFNWDEDSNNKDVRTKIDCPTGNPDVRVGVIVKYTTLLDKPVWARTMTSIDKAGNSFSSVVVKGTDIYVGGSQATSSSGNTVNYGKNQIITNIQKGEYITMPILLKYNKYGEIQWVKTAWQVGGNNTLDSGIPTSTSSAFNGVGISNSHIFAVGNIIMGDATPRDFTFGYDNSSNSPIKVQGNPFGSKTDFEAPVIIKYAP